MDKKGFLKELRLSLKGDIDQAEVVTYYSELIDEAVLNGELETDVVKRLGSVSDIVSAMGKKTNEKVKTKSQNKIRATLFWRIVGLIALVFVSFMLLSLVFSGGVGLFTNLLLVINASTNAIAYYYGFQMVTAVGIIFIASALSVKLITKIKEIINWLSLAERDK